MTEEQQYEKICKNEFAEIKEAIACLDEKLFKNNGGKCLQSRVDENAIWCSVIKWFTITLSSGILLGFVGLLFWLIKSGLTK